MSIPWCSGAERNLGHCFGNQGGDRSAAAETEGENTACDLVIQHPALTDELCVTLELRLNI